MFDKVCSDATELSLFHMATIVRRVRGSDFSSIADALFFSLSNNNFYVLSSLQHQQLTVEVE